MESRYKIFNVACMYIHNLACTTAQLMLAQIGLIGRLYVYSRACTTAQLGLIGRLYVYSLCGLRQLVDEAAQLLRGLQLSMRLSAARPSRALLYSKTRAPRCLNTRAPLYFCLKTRAPLCGTHFSCTALLEKIRHLKNVSSAVNVWCTKSSVTFFLVYQVTFFLVYQRLVYQELLHFFFPRRTAKSPQRTEHWCIRIRWYARSIRIRMHLANRALVPKRLTLLLYYFCQ